MELDDDGVLEEELNTLIDAEKEKVLVKLTGLKRPRRTKKKKNSEFDTLMSKTMKITNWMEIRTKGPEPEEIDAAWVEEHKNVCVSTHLVQANDDINIDNDKLIHRDLLDMEVSKKAKEQEVNRQKPESEELEIMNDKDNSGKDCWAIVIPVAGGEHHAKLRNQSKEQLELAMVESSKSRLEKSRSQVELKADNTGKLVDDHEIISVFKGQSGDEHWPVDSQVLAQHDHGGGEEPPLGAEVQGPGVLAGLLDKELQPGLGGGQRDGGVHGQGVGVGQVDLAQKDSGGPAYQGGEVDDLKNSDRKRASAGRRGKIMVLKNQLTLEYLKTKSAILGLKKTVSTRGPKRKNGNRWRALL